MQSKRQLQTGELIKRNFSQVLHSEGSYIYGSALVTVTNVIISPDFSLAKIYLSVYNVDDKQSVVMMMEGHQKKLRQSLATRIRRHVRRIPDIAFYLDDTLDEIYKLDNLFDRLHENKQMGEEE